MIPSGRGDGESRFYDGVIGDNGNGRRSPGGREKMDFVTSSAGITRIRFKGYILSPMGTPDYLFQRPFGGKSPEDALLL